MKSFLVPAIIGTAFCFSACQPAPEHVKPTADITPQMPSQSPLQTPPQAPLQTPLRSNLVIYDDQGQRLEVFDRRSPDTMKCQEHDCPLNDVIEPLIMGHPGFGEPEVNQARIKLFPWAQTLNASCISDGPRHAYVSYCPECREAEGIWMNEYEVRKALLRSKMVLQNPILNLDGKTAEQGMVQVSVVNGNRETFQLLDMAMQFYLQRLGNVATIPGHEYAAKIQRVDGIAYAAGGRMLYPESIRPGESYLFKYHLRISDLAPSRYRCLMMLKNEDKIISEVTVEFEIKD